MKGKLTTKTIVVIALTVVLLAIAITGTVIFLKDSGRAEAMSGENLSERLPVAGTDEEQNNNEQVVEPETNEAEEQTTSEEGQNTEGATSGTVSQTTTSGTQSSTTISGQLNGEPAVSTVEQERVISEETNLSWNNINLNTVANMNASNMGINYNNLRYTVNYYEDGILVHTEIVKENKLEAEITEVEDRIKSGYCLDTEKTTKLPFTVTENEENNIIDIYYALDKNGNGIPDDEEDKYSITYIAEGAENVPEKEENVLSGLEKTISSMVPTKAKYVFTEWTTEDVTVENGKFTMPEKDVTFTAVFKEDKNENEIPDDEEDKYSITYIAEGAENVPEKEENVLSGLEKTISSMVPTKAKYIFTEWTTEDVTVENGKFTMPNKNVTFTAVFKEDKNENEIPDDEEDKYSITYIAEGAENIPEKEENVLSGLEKTISSMVPTKAKYVFAGWTTEDVTVEKGKFTMPEKDVTFTAVFKEDKNENETPDDEENKYSITYVAEGAENVPEKEENVLSGLEKTVSDMVPTKTGYEFVNWVTEDVTVENGKFTMPEKDVTFTATFKKLEYNYTVNYYYENNLETSNKVNLDEKTFVLKETENLTANFEDIITEYKDKTIPGYKYYKVTPSDNAGKLLLKVSAIEEDNVINVYYVLKTDVSYTVNYYKENSTEKIIDSKIVNNRAFGEEITEKAENLMNKGYKVIKESVTIKLDKEDGNEINFYYKERADLSYTVKYFYNGEEDKSKEYTVNNQIFGSKVSGYADKSEGGWTLESAITPITIGVGNNIIVVKYVKPDIVVSKTADKTAAKYNENITYTIKAVNNGKKEGTVTVKDEPLQNLINDKKVQLVGTIKTSDEKTLTVSELANGVNLTIGIGKTKTIVFTVKVIANAGDKIVNTIEVEGGTKKEDESEVVSKIEKTAQIQELSETIVGKHIIIAMDRSESMRGDKLAKEKQAVCDFVGSVFPNQNINNGSTVTVMAYTGSSNTYTVGSATNYAEAQNLKNNINNVYAFGVSDIKDTLDWILNDGRCLGNVAYPNKEDNILIFIGDGNPSALFTNINKNAIEKKLEPIEAKTLIYVVGTYAKKAGKERLHFIARSGEYYDSSYDGLSSTLGEVTVKINRLPKRTPSSSNGKIELNSKLFVDENHPIVINGISYTLLPTDKIKLDNGKYYLDLTQFSAAEQVSVTYYIH